MTHRNFKLLWAQDIVTKWGMTQDEHGILLGDTSRPGPALDQRCADIYEIQCNLSLAKTFSEKKCSNSEKFATQGEWLRVENVLTGGNTPLEFIREHGTRALVSAMRSLRY